MLPRLPVLVSLYWLPLNLLKEIFHYYLHWRPLSLHQLRIPHSFSKGLFLYRTWNIILPHIVYIWLLSTHTGLTFLTRHTPSHDSYTVRSSMEKLLSPYTPWEGSMIYSYLYHVVSKRSRQYLSLRYHNNGIRVSITVKYTRLNFDSFLPSTYGRVEGPLQIKHLVYPPGVLQSFISSPWFWVIWSLLRQCDPPP